MPIIHSSRRAAAALSLLARLSVPIVLSAGGAAAQACAAGASNVAVGKLYVSDNPTYDQFFSGLYQIQLPMGQAADREAGNRARVANALSIPPSSSAEQIADALDQRAVSLTKAGIGLKVQTAALDSNTPSADLAVAGSVSKPVDLALISALTQSLKDEALLMGELRRQRPEIDRLKPQADALEPGIDFTFRKGGSPKKSEVRRNVVDAQRIIPLMAQRSDDLEHLAKDFIQKIQKVLGAAPGAAPPVVTPPPPTPEPAPAPPPKKAGGKAKPGPTHTEAAAPKPKAEEPQSAAEAKPEPKSQPKTKPPADDFEP